MKGWNKGPRGSWVGTSLPKPISRPGGWGWDGMGWEGRRSPVGRLKCPPEGRPAEPSTPRDCAPFPPSGKLGGGEPQVNRLPASEPPWVLLLLGARQRCSVSVYGRLHPRVWQNLPPDSAGPRHR